MNSDKTFLYEFEHHVESASSLDIDKYRKTITYPKMEQKSMLCDGPAIIHINHFVCDQTTDPLHVCHESTSLYL